MPSPPSGMTSLQPPRPSVFDSTEEKSRYERRDTATRLDSKVKENGKPQSSPEWEDVDDNLAPRRRKRTRRSATLRTPSSTLALQRSQRQSLTDLGRFLPRLSQILESSEPRPAPAQRSQSGEHTSSKRNRYKDDGASVASYRRPVRSKNISVQHRHDSRLKPNASLLSVISGLTTSTDRSSGSNSTLTQRSYSRGSYMYQDTPTRRSRGEGPARYSSMPRSSAPPARSPYSANGQLFDDQDARSDVSASTSTSLRSSVGASSTLSGTPSSRSTYPSPTFSRDGRTTVPPPKSADHGEIMGSAHDHHASSIDSGRELGQSELASIVESSICTESDNDCSVPPSARSSPQQEHLAPMPTHPYAYAERYLGSFDARETSVLPPGQQHAMQQRMITAMPDGGEMYPHFETGDDTHTVAAPPPVPEAPDANTKTLTGYELLASELCTASQVQPLYRKFEYLNHRLLLHLQDELAELEEQLRVIDEIAAHMEPDATGKRLPCSRRGEAYYGADIHHHRTSLLGRIFIKTEQYNKAMSSYSAMSRDSTPAQTSQIEAYRQWMIEHNPIHEDETQFLRQEKDLIAFDQQRATQRSIPAYNSAVAVGAPIIWCLPVVLLTIAPTVASRLAVLVACVLAASALIFTTRLRQALTLKEWLVSIASYSLCFAALAIYMQGRADVPKGV